MLALFVYNSGEFTKEDAKLIQKALAKLGHKWSMSDDSYFLAYWISVWDDGYLAYGSNNSSKHKDITSKLKRILLRRASNDSRNT